MTLTAQRTFDDIVNGLERLNKHQLDAVYTIVIALAAQNADEAQYVNRLQYVDDVNTVGSVSPLGIRTEEQLWSHIERSVALADAGIGEDVDEVIDELMREFGV